MGEGKIEVSIIIINYNTRELTTNCIDSIDCHTQKNRFEVIVIDNGSSDESYNALSTLGYENYHYIYNEKNIGFSRANNRAAIAASGDYLFFMNSDMVFVNDVEDADICRQVRDRRLKIMYTPSAILIHFGGQSSQLNSYKAVWPYYFAFYYLYKKYYFGKCAVLIKPVFFLRALIGVMGNYFKKDKRVTWNNK